MSFVFGWLLNGVYLLLLAAIAPVLITKRLTQGKYRRGWREKLTGKLSRQYPERPCIWFHAVSVGEVVLLQTVLADTAARFPDAELLVTVTTETGYDVARTKYPQHSVAYFPLDFTWAVGNALTVIRPDLIVLVELELWPNFILTARRRRLPLVLINGRIGEKSFRGYARLKPLMTRLLSCFDALAVQNEIYAERLLALGAPTKHVHVTGNIKFDGVQADRDNPKTLELRSALRIHPSDRVLIAGSTQAPEESYALETWLELRNRFPGLRLILVPRHKERFEEVAKLVRQRGCTLIRRSEATTSIASAIPANRETEVPPVGLLDTLGELAACWGLADIAFVGGSLTNRGGQNMIEPAGYGDAVLFGPNTWNFKDVAEALLSHRAARVVAGPDDLLEAVDDLLRRPEEARRMGDAARAFVATQQGATQRTVELIATALTRRTTAK
jgi:3-deoxy-D-manno-octulosonic-acid transferase